MIGVKSLTLSAGRAHTSHTHTKAILRSLERENAAPDFILFFCFPTTLAFRFFFFKLFYLSLPLVFTLNGLSAATEFLPLLFFPKKKSRRLPLYVFFLYFSMCVVKKNRGRGEGKKKVSCVRARYATTDLSRCFTNGDRWRATQRENEREKKK